MVHVLVVDDDAAIRKMLFEVLTLEEYSVEGAARDGREALEILRASPYPLVVITDNLMPVMSGLEMLDIVARDPTLATRHVYVMMATHFYDHADVLQTLNVAIMYRPFSIQQLLEVVEEAVKRLPPEE